jgi:hypothetical protein
VIVVDGHLGDSGAVALDITPVTCPTQDVSGVTMPLTLSTASSTDTYDGACGGSGYADRAVRYTAPSAGLYRFTAESPDFLPVLYVDRGPECGGTNLQCSYGIVNSHGAEVTRYLEANESVTVTVDGRSGTAGSYTLDIQPVAGSCPTQPEIQGTVTNVTPSSSLLSGSCWEPGNAMSTYSDVSYPVHVDLPTLQSCSITIDRLTEDNGPVVLVLITGDHCEGEEVLCETLSASDTSWGITFSPTGDLRNGDYVFMVQNAHPFAFEQTFDITSDCN